MDAFKLLEKIIISVFKNKTSVEIVGSYSNGLLMLDSNINIAIKTKDFLKSEKLKKFS